MHVLAFKAPTTAEYVWIKQSVQALAAWIVTYFPATQFSHTALPEALLKVPGTQTLHGPPFGPEYPGLHKQLLKAVPVEMVVVFSGQFWHDPAYVELLAKEYFPVAHVVQVPLML